MRISYNAPVVLTFTFICTIITALDTTLFTSGTVGRPGSLCSNFFCVYPFGSSYMSSYDPFMYFRLFSHAMGHGGWEHLTGNFTIILLLGPILEEKYGSRTLLTMIFTTALVTGILQATMFLGGLLGASGIVFMMIILSSYTNAKQGTIPLSFILVAILFLGKEIYGAMFVHDGVSQFAHIIGGIAGGLFAFAIANQKVATK
ncbi:MAG: rhomboid family intramembrane serine protease [Bacteroidetes bacterium]|nr:MAG: rhomboid family intramembrane serine protease [Bacteroidota bacterium]